MTIVIDISDDLRQRLDRMAAAQQRSASAVTVAALEAYVARGEFIASAEANWQAYQDDGLHLTLDEAVGWLEGWGTDFETEMPACHK